MLLEGIRAVMTEGGPGRGWEEDLGWGGSGLTVLRGAVCGAGVKAVVGCDRMGNASGRTRLT